MLIGPSTSLHNLLSAESPNEEDQCYLLAVVHLINKAQSFVVSGHGSCSSKLRNIIRFHYVERVRT